MLRTWTITLLSFFIGYLSLIYIQNSLLGHKFVMDGRILKELYSNVCLKETEGRIHEPEIYRHYLCSYGSLFSYIFFIHNSAFRVATIGFIDFLYMYAELPAFCIVLKRSIVWRSSYKTLVADSAHWYFYYYYRGSSLAWVSLDFQTTFLSSLVLQIITVPLFCFLAN